VCVNGVNRRPLSDASLEIRNYVRIFLIQSEFERLRCDLELNGGWRVSSLDFQKPKRLSVSSTFKKKEIWLREISYTQTLHDGHYVMRELVNVMQSFMYMDELRRRFIGTSLCLLLLMADHHFQTKEEIFTLSRYSAYHKHTLFHSHFKEQLEVQVEQYYKCGDVNENDLSNLLQSLVRHMQEDDTKLLTL
jgi:hemerythrin